MQIHVYQRFLSLSIMCFYSRSEKDKSGQHARINIKRFHFHPPRIIFSMLLSYEMQADLAVINKCTSM